MRFQSILRPLMGGLLVSCQAPEGDPFRNRESIARFAQAAERGGAAGLRINSPEDVEAARRVTALPIIGIQKRYPNGHMWITPSFEDARELVRAGAGIVAIQCTAGETQMDALRLIRRVHDELQVPVMADIATLEEAVAAESAGADLVASTMRGYTSDTCAVGAFEPEFIARLFRQLRVHVIAEGRVETPEQAVQALNAGAFALIVGGAITSPESITRRFMAAIQNARKAPPDVLGMDLGGTKTKVAVLCSDGALQGESVVDTPGGGGELLTRHLVELARSRIEEAKCSGRDIRAVGIASAGWIDAGAGRVVYATENLPGWTNTEVRDHLEAALNVPVAVENDANALAIAEHRFGRARGVRDFLCITLGTGVGGASFSGGQLVRGANCLAGAFGHFPLIPDGIPCGCGLSGCLECYTSAKALVGYAGQRYTTAEEVIRAAHDGDGAARKAVVKYAGYLVSGIAAVTQMLDPELVILSGGLAQHNDLLFSELADQLPRHIMAPRLRRLKIVRSELGYYGGVSGAGAVARDLAQQS